MAHSIFEGCSDACGFLAAIISALSFGSHGVTVKESSRRIVDVDPLVMQTYKTIVFYLSSYLVVFLGEEIVWTQWGLISGLLWVPGATFGTLAVMLVGMATAEGTWSACMVIVNFFWGILIFEEAVKSFPETLMAFFTLVFGLIGMSLYSSPNVNNNNNKQQEAQDDQGLSMTLPNTATPRRKRLYDASPDEEITTEPGVSSSSSVETPSSSPVKAPHSGSVMIKGSAPLSGGIMTKRSTSAVLSTTSSFADDVGLENGTSHSDNGTTSQLLLPILGSSQDSDVDVDMDEKKERAGEKGPKHHTIVLFGGALVLTKRQAGILAAVMNGLWGGTSLVPMHYAAQEGFHGARYYYSYATGSMVVNTAVYMLLFFVRLVEHDFSLSKAWDALPSWHFRRLWFPGLLSGILFSVGMFGSIVAVDFLGQGVGSTFVQCKLLLSGAWGILYYREVRGASTICKWFAAASLVLVGILMLSYEHEALPHPLPHH